MSSFFLCVHITIGHQLGKKKKFWSQCLLANQASCILCTAVYLLVFNCLIDLIRKSPASAVISFWDFLASMCLLSPIKGVFVPSGVFFVNLGGPSFVPHWTPQGVGGLPLRQLLANVLYWYETSCTVLADVPGFLFSAPRGRCLVHILAAWTCLGGLSTQAYPFCKIALI